MTLTRLDCIRTNAMQLHLHHRLQMKFTPLGGIHGNVHIIWSLLLPLLRETALHSKWSEHQIEMQSLHA